MMNIIYHRTAPASYSTMYMFPQVCAQRWENTGTGLIIIEHEPHQRTVIWHTSHRYDFKGRLSFPYVYAAITYYYGIDPSDGKMKYFYGGQRVNGLFIFTTNKPMSSFDDTIYNLPSENFFVCTDHKYDNLCCESIKELTDTVLSLWWQTPFQFNESVKYKINNSHHKTWQEINIEEVLNTHWGRISNYKYTLNSVFGKKIIDKEIPLGKGLSDKTFDHVCKQSAISTVLNSLRRLYK